MKIMKESIGRATIATSIWTACCSVNGAIYNFGRKKNSKLKEIEKKSITGRENSLEDNYKKKIQSLHLTLKFTDS